MSEKGYAVVTGASRGLGKAFAEELAKRGFNLVLISTNDQILAQCQSIKNQYHVDCQCIIADLTHHDSLLKVAEELNEKYEVFFLVNNAGLGGSQKFAEADIAYYEKILDLNVRATAVLTKLLINNLLRQKKSYILNVASMAALSPIGYKLAYPASKAFVYSFSLSLREEFRGTPLSVSVVCPGAMATSPSITARIQQQGFFGRLTLVAPEKVARKAVRQTLKGRKEILVNPLSVIFSKITPNGIKTPLLTRIVRRETEKN